MSQPIVAIKNQRPGRVPLNGSNWVSASLPPSGVGVCVPNAGCWPYDASVNNTSRVNAQANGDPVLEARRVNDDVLEFRLSQPGSDGRGPIILLNGKVNKLNDGKYAVVPVDHALAGGANEIEGESNKLLVGVNRVSLNLNDSEAELGDKVNLTFKLNKDFRELEKIDLFFNQQDTAPLEPVTPAGAVGSLNAKLAKSLAAAADNDLRLTIHGQTDQFGLNLDEMTAIVDARRSYPNGYPKRDIGKAQCPPKDIPSRTPDGLIQTFYSQHPDLSIVLKGRKGSSLFEQTSYINRRYNNRSVPDCEFYGKILAYATLKYMLAGLANNGKFSLYWLYSDHNEEFIRLVRRSDFAKYLAAFEELGLVGYNKYFKASYRKNGSERPECTGSGCNKSQYLKGKGKH